MPNATLVVYLTDGEDGSGETHFPALDLKVRPSRGSVLSFMNVDAAGAPDPKSKHGVSAVSSRTGRDRVVLQIPLLATGGPGARARAYPEHVSGGKHMAHMGIMALVLAGFGAYAVWNAFFGAPGYTVDSFGRM